MSKESLKESVFFCKTFFFLSCFGCLPCLEKDEMIAQRADWRYTRFVSLMNQMCEKRLKNQCWFNMPFL